MAQQRLLRRRGCSLGHDTSAEALLAPGYLAHARSLILEAPSLELVCDRLVASILRLAAVDSLHQHALVLEHITLGLLVELAVQVLVDLLLVPVLLQQTAEDAKAADPQQLARKTCVARTTTLTHTRVATLRPRLRRPARARAAVDARWLLDNEAVLDELSDVLACYIFEVG